MNRHSKGQIGKLIDVRFCSKPSDLNDFDVQVTYSG